MNSAWLASLPPKKRQTFLAGLSDEDAEALEHDWRFWARPDQLPPAGEWVTWFIKAGRGWGKTRTGAEWVRHRVEAEGARYIALVARTPADARDVMVEGEALALDTPIPTPRGWTTMGELSVGDVVFASDGSMTSVVAVSQTWDDRPCYAVRVDGAAPIVSDERHRWVTSNRAERRSARRFTVRTTAAIADTLMRRADMCEHEVPMHQPIELPAADLPVPPYTFGAWLGDGDTRGHGTFTCHQDDSETVDQIRADGFTVRRRAGRYEWGILGIRNGLRAAGVVGRKHVPAAYLRASAAQRLALLQGLMDTDGYVSARGQCSFDNTNAALVDSVRELALTLGIKTGCVSRKPDKRGHRDMFRLTFTCRSGHPVPFRLARKARRCVVGRMPAGRLVRGVDAVASVRTRCIQVGHESGTFLAGRDFVVTHNSGLMAISPPWNRPHFEPSKRRVTWPNGAVATVFSDEVPDKLRGPQHDTAWIDEFAKFRKPQDTLDNLMMGLRLGADPRCCVTTTPKAIPAVQTLLKDPDTVVSGGSTYVNKANLSPKFLAYIKKRYEGTRLGQQELMAHMMAQAEGALWSRERIEQLRARDLPLMKRVVVAIDPAATSKADSDETGIIVAGLGEDNHGYIFDDLSDQHTPDAWAKAAVNAYYLQQADRVVAEVNQGGDLVEHTIRTVDPNVSYRAVRASKGKRTRAEPVAALYEQGKVHHVGYLGDLEDQMCNWQASIGEDSPDRVDALVWALTDLMITPGVEFKVW